MRGREQEITTSDAKTDSNASTDMHTSSAAVFLVLPCSLGSGAAVTSEDREALSVLHALLLMVQRTATMSAATAAASAMQERAGGVQAIPQVRDDGRCAGGHG